MYGDEVNNYVVTTFDQLEWTILFYRNKNMKLNIQCIFNTFFC